MYQLVMKFIKQIIQQRCKQICYQTVMKFNRDISKYSNYEEISSMLLRDVQYAIKIYQVYY